MNIHKNARLTLRGRAEAVRRVAQLGHPARQVARALDTTDATVRKWVARAAAGESLADRSSRPQHSPQASPPGVVLRIKVLRQQRWTCGEIAAQDVHPGILLSDLECLAASSFVESPRMDNPPAENLVRLHS